MSRPVSSARICFETSSLILTVAPGNYGSLELSRLAHLEAELEGWLSTSAATVILDLSQVRDSGSGLLGCLARLRTNLQRMGKSLVLCGDATGLIALVGWSELMNLQSDVAQAVRQTARSLMSI